MTDDPAVRARAPAEHPALGGSKPPVQPLAKIFTSLASSPGAARARRPVAFYNTFATPGLSAPLELGARGPGLPTTTYHHGHSDFVEASWSPDAAPRGAAESSCRTPSARYEPVRLLPGSCGGSKRSRAMLQHVASAAHFLPNSWRRIRSCGACIFPRPSHDPGYALAKRQFRSPWDDQPWRVEGGWIEPHDFSDSLSIFVCAEILGCVGVTRSPTPASMNRAFHSGRWSRANRNLRGLSALGGARNPRPTLWADWRRP